MELNNNQKLYILLCFLLCAFFCSLFLLSAARAEQRTIEAEGVYIMRSEDESSPAHAREMAEDNALRAACEKAGVLLESFTGTKDGVLTADEIRAAAQNFLEVLEKDITIEATDADTLIYRCHILAIVDSDKLEALCKQEKPHE